MKFLFSGASRAALLAGAFALFPLASTAFAQAPAAAPVPSAQEEEDAKDVDEVVVTGSFLRGTPETAAMPVEAINLEELRDKGSPSSLDFIKGMSEIGSVAGESNRLNAFAIGAQSINLRSLSASRTVVVFNGRRFPDLYSFAVGRFNNVAAIPNAAIGRVEVLKDGGATTYGADAVGGVVNYITRRNLDGVEVNANYRYIKGSTGDYDISVSGGKVWDKFNVMAVVGYIKRNELDLVERDWAQQPYLRNPTSWSSAGQPGAYVFQTNPGAAFASITTTGAGQNLYTGNRQIGATGLIRDPSCNALGGFSGFNGTGSPQCFLQFGKISNLVEEINTWQGYAEANYEFSDKLKLHGEFMYYGMNIPHTPIDNGGALPGNFPITSTSATQVASPGVSAYFVDGRNPAVGALVSSLTNSNGSPGFTAAQVSALNSANGRVALLTQSWRPWGVGGNPLYGETDYQQNINHQFRYVGELSGNLGTIFNSTWDWKASASYDHSTYELRAEDMLIERLQAALNGYGGASCAGPVANPNPGTNGCQFFNPFSSAIEKNIFTGATNPNYVGTGTYTGYTAGQGLQNSKDLINWMYVPVGQMITTDYVVVDALLRGDLGFHLWADEPLQVAIGGQYRHLHDVGDLTDNADRDKSPCATLGVTNCTTRTGPLVFNRGIQVTGVTLDNDRKYPVHSAFAELRIPVTDTFNVQTSARYEKFYSDISPVDNEVVVAAGSFRWQALDWLAVRGTVGETFSQVSPPPAIAPISSLGAAPAAYGGTGVTFTQNNYPNIAVQPETGFNYNLGAIVQAGNATMTVDYFNIKVDNIIRAGNTGQLINAVVVPGQTTATAQINCASDLLTQNNPLLAGKPFIQLATPCVQGVTTVANGLAGGVVNFFGNQGQQTALINGGSVTTAGIDLGLDWRFPGVWDGDLTVSADGTFMLDYDISDFSIEGIPVTLGYDGLSNFNRDTSKSGGQRIAQSRASLGANFRRGKHNFNWTTRFVSAFYDDLASNYTASLAFNANIPGANGVVAVPGPCTTQLYFPPIPTGAGTGTFGALDGCQNAMLSEGQQVSAQFNSDFTYRLSLPQNMTFTLTIQNVFDRQPEFSREFINYDAFSGNPLGRTFRVGILRKW